MKPTLTDLLLVVALAATACKGLPDPCESFDGQACVALEIEAGDRGPDVANVYSVDVTAESGIALAGDQTQTRYLPRSARYPLLLAVVPLPLSGVTEGALSVAAEARDGAGRIGTGIARFTLQEREHLRVRLLLDDPDAAGDLATTQDLANRDMSGGGGLAIGTICTPGLSQCVAGARCFWYQDAALCRKTCSTDANCPATATPTTTNTSHCTAIENGMTVADGCTTPCNPVPALGSSGCPAGTMCYVYQIPSVATESTNCADEGTLPEGSTCTSTLQCTDGHTCVGQAGNLHCRKVCRKSTDADCTGGYVCRSITGRTVFGACCPAGGC